ncbi:hypothetical protein BX666DRAFT_1884537 [Dichotomocladium elegans]|nr:hypothetical protein BX666DRAFT_1884537 [Dichotomocladium elegans]
MSGKCARQFLLRTTQSYPFLILPTTMSEAFPNTGDLEDWDSSEELFNEEQDDDFFNNLGDSLPIDHLVEKGSAMPPQALSSVRAESEGSSKQQTLRTRLAGLSATKAGLDTVDKEKVNQIIYEASKGSAFFENERKKDEQVTERIKHMMAKFDKIKDADLSVETRMVDNMIRGLEKERDLSQVICHVDMDAFYASVEELDSPELKKVPMAVGSMSMLCTSNYEARKYGVRSAMPGYIAMKLCPQLRIIPLHPAKYQEASDKVRAIFAKYDPDFAPMSLDEAYLNLTDYLKTTDLSPPELVKLIRKEIFEATGLTASAGIGPNKMLSKICSDIDKPNGQHYLPNDIASISNFVKDLQIRKIPGVGRVTERVLMALGVETCSDIYEKRAVLYRLLSPASFRFILQSHLGISSTVIHARSEQKSISVERTFTAISSKRDLFSKVDELSKLLEKALEEKQIKGKTIGIKLKLDTFEMRVRAKTLMSSVWKASEIARVAKELVAKEMPISLRLMGIRVSSLEKKHDDHVTKFFFTSTKRPNPEYEDNDTSETVTCPICKRRLRLDNAAFNRHVDECLNRQAVRSILDSERGAAHAPASSSSSSSIAYSASLRSIPSSSSINPKKMNGTLLHYYSRSA